MPDEVKQGIGGPVRRETVGIRTQRDAARLKSRGGIPRQGDTPRADAACGRGARSIDMAMPPSNTGPSVSRTNVTHAGETQVTRTSNQIGRCCTETRLIGHSLLVAGRLDAAAALQGPVAVLHGADVPALGALVELELEGLVVRDVVLVGRHVHACGIARGETPRQSNCSMIHNFLP